ncbi:MAG TPA: LPS-assembly protein LptD [Nitrospirae bacterium]|nr:LPS-assembly protein LptD [Nitrospirota bacterium]
MHGRGLLKRRALLFAAVVVLSVFIPSIFPSTGGAEEAETVIEAESLTYDSARQVYHLRGDVRIRRLDSLLRADEADFIEKTREARASGDVRYEDGLVVIEADKLRINIATKRGLAYNARLFVKKDNYRIRAEEIERLGERDYVIRKATFTTCDAPLPAWCFSSRKTDVRIGDRLKARNVLFRIKGLPVLYSPLLWAPIYTERKSGLLLPEPGFRSDKGFFYRQPLFLVLAGNRDATLYFDLYTRRGIGEGLEYRYIERSAGAGKWWLYHLRDRELGKDFFEFRGEHALSTKVGASGFLNIHYISDRSFYREYSQMVQLRTRRFLESTAEASYSFGKGRAFLFGRAWQDLKESSGGVLQKVPEAGLSLYPSKKGPLYVSLQARFSNFYSKDFERVRRLDIRPTIYHTAGDAVQLSQVVSLRETLYSIDNSGDFPDNMNRGVLDYRVRLHARLRRRYPAFTHVVEPEVGYRFVPPVEADVPLLDSKELDLRSSVFDFGLRSHFFDDKGRLASVRLTGSYDTHAAGAAFGGIRLEAALFRPLSFRLDTSYDPESGLFEQVNYSASWRRGRAGVSFGQRYSRDDGILFYSGGVSLPVTRNLALSSSLWYDAEAGRLEDLRLVADYSAQCWGMNVTFNRRPDDYSILFLVELKGLGTVSFSGI